MENYTRNEKVDMLLVFGECKQNALQAAAMYAERFPERRHPTRHYFPRLMTKMRAEPNEVAGNGNFIVNEDKEIDVLAYVEVHINASTREIAAECQISRNSVWRILRKHKYRSYKYQLHQHLYETDYQRRLEYCNWFLQKYHEDHTFPYKILYTDESRFTNLGIFNRNNKRYWANENLHLIEEGNFQERFGFNCWMGILGDRILGPIVFDDHLTGERYLQFLSREIENFLDEIPLANRNGIFYQQDGAPPHNTWMVSAHLNNTYGENCIGNSGPVRWPPRSPDLTPLDYYLWGTIKNEVYNTPAATRNELENRVRVAINSITPMQLQNVINKTIQRTELCQQQQGGHFEHLLH